MSRNSLPKSKDFATVFASKCVRSNAFLVLRWRPRADEDETQRLGLVVSKAVGTAVVRNRLRRVLREAFYAVCEEWPRSHYYVLIARPRLVEVDTEGGVNAVIAQLRTLTPLVFVQEVDTVKRDRG
jgi:ribonuclease P protein component